MSVPTLPQLLVSHWRVAWALELQGVLYAGLYLVAVQRARGHWPLARTLSFLAGIGCVLVALQSGIDTFEHRLLSVHMVQHMLLLMVAPLLLLGGRPVILVLRALRGEPRRGLARALGRIRPLTGPLQGLLVFTAVVLATHLPSSYGATLRNPGLHDAEHALYLLAGLLLWWPIMDGDPVPRHRLGGLGRLVYVIAAMTPMAVLGAFLNRHSAVLYSGYGPAAHRLGISALVDQQQAGAIMWVGGSTIMVAIGLWVTVAALVADERRQRAREARADSTVRGDSVFGGGPAL